MTLKQAQKLWPDAMQMKGKGQGIVLAFSLGKSLYGHTEFIVLHSNIICSPKRTTFNCIFSHAAWVAKYTAKEAAGS